MTFAPRNILRKIPTGPNPPPSDLFTLLGSKLRVFFDARFGGEFAPGVWTAHADQVSGLRLAAPSPGTRVLCEADGTNFRGVRVQRISSTGDTKLVARGIPARLLPLSSRSEVFCVARLLTIASSCICGAADDATTLSSGAQLFGNNASSLGVTNGNTHLTFPFSDTSAPHVFGGANDSGTERAFVDGAQVASGATLGTSFTATQVAVGGFDVGFGTSANAYVAAWGVVMPIMTDAERAIAYSILRNDWGL